jgi:hypothetical protein
MRTCEHSVVMAEQLGRVLGAVDLVVMMIDGVCVTRSPAARW